MYGYDLQLAFPNFSIFYFSFAVGVLVLPSTEDPQLHSKSGRTQPQSQNPVPDGGRGRVMLLPSADYRKATIKSRKLLSSQVFIML